MQDKLQNVLPRKERSRTFQIRVEKPAPTLRNRFCKERQDVPFKDTNWKTLRNKQTKILKTLCKMSPRNVDMSQKALKSRTIAGDSDYLLW